MTTIKELKYWVSGQYAHTENILSNPDMAMEFNFEQLRGYLMALRDVLVLIGTKKKEVSRDGGV